MLRRVCNAFVNWLERTFPPYDPPPRGPRMSDVFDLPLTIHGNAGWILGNQAMEELSAIKDSTGKIVAVLQPVHAKAFVYAVHEQDAADRRYIALAAAQAQIIA